MEQFRFTKTEAGFHIEGYPDAEKVVRIEGKKAQRLADLCLHMADLNFCICCLDGIGEVPDQPYTLREGLWRSAIVHFAKCFGSSKSRFGLDRDSVYGKDDGAKEAYKYIISLRHKHIVHDENPYAQAIPGAILNRRDARYKIAKIVCAGFVAQTLNEGDCSNLYRLATLALEWVTAQHDSLCESLTTELEGLSYDELFAREEVTYSAPSVEAVHSTRSNV